MMEITDMVMWWKRLEQKNKTFKVKKQKQKTLFYFVAVFCSASQVIKLNYSSCC